MEIKNTEYRYILEPMIKNIIMELRTKPYLDISLLGGDFGAVLSLYYASKYNLCSKSQADELLDKTFRSLSANATIPFTYCDGLAGLCIGLNQLEKDGFIEGANEASLIHFNKLLNCLHNIISTNLDFLHGSIGISMYFMLFKNDERSIKIIEDVILRLHEDSLHHPNGGIYWKFPNRNGENTENLSLSHGISAVAMFLARAQKMKIKDTVKALSVEMLSRIGTYLKFYLLSPAKDGFYTPLIPTKNKSRLGWCYGDVGTSIALRAISKYTNNIECATLAYEIAKYAALHRKDTTSNFVFDACICHGSAGLIPYFKNCFNHYSDKEFIDAVQYWTDVTIRMAKPYNGIKRFDHYFPPLKRHLNSINILEGDSGVAMALFGENSLLDNLLLFDDEI